VAYSGAMDLFIFHLFSDDPADRFFFVAWVLVVIISIVLHELAHGWMAVRLGDDTPLRLNRMTGNPLVHMGPFSLLALAIAGIAWGSMPIDPSRTRGRYAEAKIAAAGPATNLLLATVALVAIGLLQRYAVLTGDGWQANLTTLLWTAGSANLLLCAFNLLPVPPLDGSRVLANFNRGYARFIDDPKNHGALMLMFFGAFFLAGVMFDPVIRLALQFVSLVRGY